MSKISPEIAAALLGIALDSSAKDVEDAYKLKARLLHPDRFELGTKSHAAAEDSMKQLNAARDTMSDYIKNPSKYRLSQTSSNNTSSNTSSNTSKKPQDAPSRSQTNNSGESSRERLSRLEKEYKDAQNKVFNEDKEFLGHQINELKLEANFFGKKMLMFVGISLGLGFTSLALLTATWIAFNIPSPGGEWGYVSLAASIVSGFGAFYIWNKFIAYKLAWQDSRARQRAARQAYKRFK